MLSHEEKAEMEFYLNRIEAKTSKSDIRTSDEGHASRKIGLGNMIQGTSEADVIGSGSAPSASQSGSANTSVANANIPNRAKRRQIADTRRGLRISNLRGKKYSTNLAPTTQLFSENSLPQLYYASLPFPLPHTK